MATDTSVTISFIPGEVVTAGTNIIVGANSPIDPDSAQSVISIVHAGSLVELTVTVSDRIATVSTTGLAPGGYDFMIGELLDTSGNRLSKFITRPLIIRKATGSVSADLRIEYAINLAIGETFTKRLSPRDKNPPGTQFVEMIKAVHVKDGRSVDIAFDEDGKRVDGARLITEVSRRRFAKFGRIHETLWNHLQNLSDNQSVDVVIWPRIKQDVSSHRKIVPGEPLPAEETELISRFHYMRSKIISRLQELGAHVPRSSLNVPPALRGVIVYVHASVAARHIHTLAQSKHVGVVLLDDRTAVNDLKDSMAITHSDDVQTNLGYSGQGVRVAIFEAGPKNTDNLVFDGRYNQDPPDSDHARLVSAIVKNIEPGRPHGHAPECSLYSANSYDNAALTWATDQSCTIISQSFHRSSEENSATLSSDDLLKDWLVKRSYPTIVHAAGNGPPSEYVNHKGYNTLAIGSHDDDAYLMSGTSVYRNPSSPHGDRELPELAANGVAVTALGLTKSGTSFSAPAVAGVVALMQEADPTLKIWPEGCRAILMAGSNRKLAGTTWWADVGISREDSKMGAGALDGRLAVLIAQHRFHKNNDAAPRGWDATVLYQSDVDSDKLVKYRYYVQAPGRSWTFDRLKAKVAIAWDSTVSSTDDQQFTSVLDTDLDLLVWDSAGNTVSQSTSFDNSYEVADFDAIPGEIYQIVIRRNSGTDQVWYGVAWTVEETSWRVDRPGTSGFTRFKSSATIAIGSYETTNDPAAVSQGAKNSAVLSFGPSEPTDPQIVTGLNMIDMGNTSGNNWDIRLTSFADNINTKQFTLHIDTWADTMLYNARVSWLQLAATESDIQCGIFKSSQSGNVNETVTFPQAFAQQPIVFVGLCRFDIGDNWRIELSTSNITETSFDIHISTWGSSSLWSAHATWIAIPADKAGVLIGDFTGTSSSTWKGSTTFPVAFDRIPSLFTALTRFDVDHFHNFRVRVDTEASETDLRWNIKTWSDTTLYVVRAAYLAIAL